jgi:D-aminoacyl-tRNA deacylase
MIALIQKVTEASVSSKGYKTARIGNGFVVFLGVAATDTTQDTQKLASKLLKLRLFEDSAGKMNLPVTEIDGEILVVSQFTLLADIKSGNRPSFHLAAEKVKAEKFYELFVAKLMLSGLKVKTGFFQTTMKVKLINNGPLTIWLDSKKL